MRDTATDASDSVPYPRATAIENFGEHAWPALLIGAIVIYFVAHNSKVEEVAGFAAMGFALLHSAFSFILAEMRYRKSLR